MKNILWLIELQDLNNGRTFLFNSSKSLIIKKFRNNFDKYLMNMYSHNFRNSSLNDKNQSLLKGNKNYEKNKGSNKVKEVWIVNQKNNKARNKESKIKVNLISYKIWHTNKKYIIDQTNSRLK